MSKVLCQGEPAIENKAFYYRPEKSMYGYLNKRPGKDAGFDLFAQEDTIVWPFQTKTIKTNVHMHIPDGHFGHVTNRGGHASRGWLTYSGIVDCGYTGNIMVMQMNCSFFPRKIRKGERLAQLIFVPFSTPELIELETLTEYKELVAEQSQSDRGNQACNSSGIM